jgi:hypothetical protein
MGYEPIQIKISPLLPRRPDAAPEGSALDFNPPLILNIIKHGLWQGNTDRSGPSRGPDLDLAAFRAGRRPSVIQCSCILPVQTMESAPNPLNAGRSQ